MKIFLLTLLTSITVSCQQQDIDKALNRISLNNSFSGAILFAINDSIIINNAYGFSDKKRQITNSSNTIFPIASITKLFIKQAVLCLVDSQKLSLKDTLAQYCDYIKFADRITISDLLYHKSGLPDIHNRIPHFNCPNELKDSTSTTKLFDFINSFQQLEFKPGSQVSYSNSNYLILAHIIENLTDTALDIYLKETIFSPYSMLQSGLYKYYSTEKGHTAGFYFLNDTTNYVPNFNFRNFWGSGNAYSTTQNLFNYFKNSQKNLKYEISSQLIAHSGYYLGFRSYYKVIPEIGMAIIILSNNGNFNNDLIINELIKYIKEKYLKKISHNKRDNNSFIGSYYACRNMNSMTIEVTNVNNELRLNNTRLFQIAENRFLIDNNSLTTVSFKVKNNNNIVELTINDNGEILIFAKKKPKLEQETLGFSLTEYLESIMLLPMFLM